MTITQYENRQERIVTGKGQRDVTGKGKFVLVIIDSLTNNSIIAYNSEKKLSSIFSSNSEADDSELQEKLGINVIISIVSGGSWYNTLPYQKG